MIPPLRRAFQPLPRAARSCKSQALNRRYFRGETSQVTGSSKSPRSRKAAFIASAAVGAALLYYLYPTQVQPNPTPARAQIKFEEPRKKARSSEENKDLISSQHLQVKHSWENPGVYAWGSNVGRVVAPDSDETVIKKPRRIAYFDGKLLRDIKLDKLFGAAISESGDLLQWGTGFSSTSRGPTPTLKGKDLVKITISRDRIIALSSNGTVYSVPGPQDNRSGSKPREHSWFQFWKSASTSSTSYRTMRPTNLGWGERITDISSGLDHCLLLTSTGRVFSASTGTDTYPSKGQLGLHGLTLTKKSPEPYDQPHELSALKGSKITKIATGDYHSLVLNNEGRIFSFGDNSSGQLGFRYSSETATVDDIPTIIPVENLYNDRSIVTRVTNIAAGGANSFFTVDAARISAQTEDDPHGLGRTTADTWACGQGILGALGDGRWTHMQDSPTKIKALSGLCEYDEIKNTVVPIRVRRLSVGATHVSAVLDNVTNLGANSGSSKTDTNWGSDVLWWGGNEFYQLGTGKRNNVNSPTYIPPLDVEAGNVKKGEEHRFQITPRKKIRVGKRKVSVEQRIECGNGATAVYSGT